MGEAEEGLSTCEELDFRICQYSSWLPLFKTSPGELSYNPMHRGGGCRRLGGLEKGAEGLGNGLSHEHTPLIRAQVLSNLVFDILNCFHTKLLMGIKLPWKSQIETQVALAYFLSIFLLLMYNYLNFISFGLLQGIVFHISSCSEHKDPLTYSGTKGEKTKLGKNWRQPVVTDPCSFDLL